MFKLLRHLSSDQLERQIMTSVFGVPHHDMDRALQPARDDDGKVPDMGKRNRVFDIEKLYQEFLLTPHAVNCLTRKFLEVFAKGLEDASEKSPFADMANTDSEAEWATVNFYEWLKGTCSRPDNGTHGHKSAGDEPEPRQGFLGLRREHAEAPIWDSAIHGQEGSRGTGQSRGRKILESSKIMSTVFPSILALRSADENEDVAAIRSSAVSISRRVTLGLDCGSGSVADMMRSTHEAKSVPFWLLQCCSSLSRAVPRTSARLMIGSRRLSWMLKTRSGLRSGNRQDKKATASGACRGIT
jgi:hypothetical protein